MFARIYFCLGFNPPECVRVYFLYNLGIHLFLFKSLTRTAVQPNEGRYNRLDHGRLKRINTGRIGEEIARKIMLSRNLVLCCSRLWLRYGGLRWLHLPNPHFCSIVLNYLISFGKGLLKPNHGYMALQLMFSTRVLKYVTRLWFRSVDSLFERGEKERIYYTHKKKQF